MGIIFGPRIFLLLKINFISEITKILSSSIFSYSFIQNFIYLFILFVSKAGERERERR